MNKQVLLLILIAFMAGIAAVYYNNTRHADLPPPSPTGGDFVLQSKNGPFNLVAHRGKMVLIYFGYTFCPDICPTNLALMAQALNELSAAELQRVTPVFISVDPDRDTLEQLQNYTDYFHPNIVGITGSDQAVAETARKYGAAYHKVTGESEGGYLVDHSSFTYLVDQNGRLAHSFPHATEPLVMIETIRRYLMDKPAQEYLK